MTILLALLLQAIIPEWIAKKSVDSGVIVRTTHTNPKRRCIYLYTYWTGNHDYERLVFCTVPYKVPEDVVFLEPYAYPFGMQPERKPDPKRILESYFPKIECEGKGCENE